jgi:FkbM family methyltransferase
VALPFGPDSSMRSEAKTVLLRGVDGAVGVSETVAEYARRWGGMEAVHAPISLVEARGWPRLGRFSNRFITMVNPCAVKGISILLGLADALPKVEFAAVPGWGASEDDMTNLRRRANITLLPPVENIDEVLAETRVMLAPSLWAEARSRLILESMTRGVPVLASDVGGLREAMLGVDYLLPVNPVRSYAAAVDDLMVPRAETPAQDIGPWRDALVGLLGDERAYAALAERARSVAVAYASSLTAAPFEAYLGQVLARPRRSRSAAPQRSPRARVELSPEKQRLLARRMRERLAAERAGSLWTPPEGREEAAAYATARARAALATSEVEVLWDGGWFVRVGPHWLPQDGAFFAHEPDWAALARRPSKYLRDAEDYWFHVYRPAEGDTIVDIGAGRGEDVFAFSRAVGRSGRVIAIEAHPESFALLRQFCMRNQLGNVTAIHCACMDRRVALSMETMAVWESNFVTEAGAGAVAAIDGVPFDELQRELGLERIDFLKMNIEGAERVALPGCREALPRTRSICVAAHDFRADRGEGEHFRTRSLVRNLLSQAGFEILIRESDPRYYVPYHVHGFRSRESRHAPVL